MRFERTRALDGLDLSVAEGSIVAVMGPSGCGKSTLLRVIAGLQQPDRGTVQWSGRDLTGVPTHLRRFGLMFQDFALFPHKTVAQNVGFGLRMHDWEPAAAEGRVAEMLDIVGLAGYGDRSVDRLSGGEQQRVALARTLAPRPRLLMLDEPLGSLDRTLRDRLAAEMRDTFRRLGLTAIYVTHDQDEAFSIGDEIAVMEAGCIVRRGTAQRLWTDPGLGSVARLIGHDNVIAAADARRLGLPAGPGGAVIPASAISLMPDPVGPAIVDATTLRSGQTRIEVLLADLRLVSSHPSAFAPGDTVSVTIDPDAVILLTAGASHCATDAAGG